MGLVRRTISFVLAFAMAVGGNGALVYHLLIAERVPGRIAAAPILVLAGIGFLGLYWL